MSKGKGTRRPPMNTISVINDGAPPNDRPDPPVPASEGDRGRIKPNDSRLRYAITPHGSLGRLISNYFDDQDPS